MTLLMEPHILVLRGQAQEPTLETDATTERERVEALVSLTLAMWEWVKHSTDGSHLTLDDPQGLPVARDWYRVLTGFQDILRSLKARADRVGLSVVAGLDGMEAVERELEVILSISPDAIVRARQDAMAGRTRTIGEVRHALRDRVHS